MGVVSYGDFSRVLHGRQTGPRTPLDVSIELTDRCPLRCVQCYNNLPVSDKEARSLELSKDEHFQVLDELADLGCLWLLYTGGEIFARPDFLEIYTYAKRKGFLITLFTNATLITEKIADYLCEWPPFAIEVTLYGRTRETYEAVTGVAGSYDRCLRGIDLLRSRQLPLKLKTVANSINRDEVLAMKRFAEEELHVQFKFEGVLNPRTDGSQSPLAFRLSPEEVVGFDLQLPGAADEYCRLADEDLRGPDGPDDRRYGCAGGAYSFAIDPYGRMSLCMLSRTDVYDIRSGGLKRGWEQFVAEVRDRRTTRETRCSSCRIRSLCNMCPAFGELENGDPETAVEFLCEVAHLRALALARKIPAHGACPYCPGGERYGALRETASRVTEGKRNDANAGAPVCLRVVNQSGTGNRNDCSSCK
jgi:radical SAM protein with 4Fe4S-binding SPASM domain